jgi:actinorhodin biosynthesis protein ActVIA
MTATDIAVRSDLYAQVLHFYARQMQSLDDCRFADYAATFTEDGSFQHSPQAEPALTRSGIVAELVAFHRRFDDDPVRRRHWFNHVLLDPLPDGTIKATIYALIVTIKPGGKPEIAPSCVVNDILTLENDAVLTKSRVVSHDQFF